MKYVIVNGCIRPVNNQKDYLAAIKASNEAHDTGENEYDNSNGSDVKGV